MRWFRRKPKDLLCIRCGMPESDYLSMWNNAADDDDLPDEAVCPSGAGHFYIDDPNAIHPAFRQRVIDPRGFSRGQH